MIIDILCKDGSPLGVTMKSLYGEDGRLGIGGAENALLTMCEAWHNAGHVVTLYNNPDQPNASPFKQKMIHEFNGQNDRDILIVFRSPNDLAKGAKGKIVWWSCDPHTNGSFAQFASVPDAIVGISAYHASYLQQKYGIVDAKIIDIPVRMMDYQEEVEKVPYQCIFNSVPDRGLLELQSVWGRIVAQVPDATLVITSDWRLWNRNIHPGLTLKYQRAFTNMPGVTYLGAIPRREMVNAQQQSDLHLYPCVFEEMFCISVAENQVAGAYPITSTTGALITTNMGTLIHGDVKSAEWKNEFVNKAVSYLQNRDELKIKRAENVEVAKERFSIERALVEWDKVFNE